MRCKDRQKVSACIQQNDYIIFHEIKQKSGGSRACTTTETFMKDHYLLL